MQQLSNKIKIRNRLLTRLLLSHILIVTIPLFITGNVLVNTAQNSIRQTILDRNLEFANRSTRFIDLQLRTATDLVKSQAQFQSIFEMNKSTQELAINTLFTEFDLFRQLSVLDTLGNLIASTSFEDSLHMKFGRKDRITGILAAFARDGRYHSDVYVSDESLPMLDVAEPVTRFGEVVGILYAIVDLKAMWDIVDENKVGDRGEAFIFNNEGVYVAHTDRRKLYSNQKLVNPTVVAQIKQGKSGQLIYHQSPNVEMVAAYAPIGNYGWGAMLQQPTSEAFAPARRMRFRVMQFMFISVLLASLLAFFYSRWIVKPVKQLVSGMEQFSQGELNYRIAKVTDDEIGTLAENFNEMAERLIEFQNKLKRTEVLETLGKLASVLSHEIRNPLNSMVINMQILKRELAKEKINKERVEKFYGILAAEIKRVDQLVTDVLLIARPPQTRKEKVAINEVIDEITMMQVADSLGKGIRIEREYEKVPILANVDIAKIRQVILNLTLNAIQAMPGGGKLTIGLKETTTAMLGNHRTKAVVLSFADSGDGISKKDLGKVFDFYYSTKDTGTGLGLAIVQQIVDEHQGRIALESQIEKGTKFTIYLPVE